MLSFVALALLVCCTIVSASYIPLNHYEQQEHGLEQNKYGHEIKQSVDYYAYPKYKFEYDVKDLHTGDIKSQSEQRDGDRVDGHYTVVESDGTIRLVQYHADKHTGFNAEVKKIGTSEHNYVNKLDGKNEHQIYLDGQHIQHIDEHENAY